jgi:hypothetical protein
MLTVAITKKVLEPEAVRTMVFFSVPYLLFVCVRDIIVNNLDFDFVASDIIFLFKYIFLSYLFVLLLKEKTMSYIVTVMVDLTILSLFFFVLQIAGFAEDIYRISSGWSLANTVNIDGYTNFLIFSFTRNRHDYANSGFVWEPGAFGCFLIIALMFHFFINKFRLDFKAWILIIGILTTFSTKSYIAFLVLLFLAYRYRQQKIRKSFFILLPAFIILIIAVPFLGNKIVETYYADLSDLNRLSVLERFYHKQNTQIPLNRFASMSYIYDSFRERLVLGVSNKYDVILNKKMDVNVSNGVFDFLAKFGLVGFVILVYSYLKFCFNYLHRFELLFYSLLILFIIGFGEPVLHLPIVLLFLFLPLVLQLKSSTSGFKNKREGLEYYG